MITINLKIIAESGIIPDRSISLTLIESEFIRLLANQAALDDNLKDMKGSIMREYAKIPEVRELILAEAKKGNWPYDLWGQP